MFYFRRIILSSAPSTSSSRTEFQRLHEGFRRFSAAGAEQSEHGFGNFVHVSTTGYSFQDENGRRMSKYGVYWGPNDVRNGIRTLPAGKSNIAAMLTAILEVINVAREEDPPPSLLIYSDLTSAGTLLKDLSGWAKRDFYARNREEKMKNSDVLRDLFLAVQGMHLKIVFKPSCTAENPKNAVAEAILEDVKKQISKKEVKLHETQIAMSWKSVYCRSENLVDPAARTAIETGMRLDKDGKLVIGVEKRYPVVYVAAKCKLVKNFTSAGYCTHWPEGQSVGGRSFRFAPFPVTLFRAELAAIEEALKEAVDASMDSVTIVTSSAHFMKAWRQRWKREKKENSEDGEAQEIIPDFYSGRIFYERIVDLCQRLNNVHFHYQRHNLESEVGKELEKKCEQGLTYLLVGKDTSEYQLETEDIVRSKEYRPVGVPIIRLFKTGTPLRAGFTWTSGNSTSAESCVGTPSVLVRILEEAVAQNQKEIVIRADSEKLIKTFEARMEIWRRNGWRNSQHKRIAKWEEWEKAWRLKQRVQVNWELMEPVDEDDRVENQKIPVYKKK